MAGGCDPVEPRRPPDPGPARLGNAPCCYCLGAAQARAARAAIPLLFLREGRIQERQAGLAGGGGREGGGRSVTPRPGLLLLRRRLPLNSDRQRVAGSWPWRGDLHAGTPGAPLPLPLLWPSLRHLSRPTLGGGGEVTGYHVCGWFPGALPCFPATSKRKRPPLTWLCSRESGSLTACSSSKEPRLSQTDLQEPRSPSNLCFLPRGAANSEGGPKAEETQEHLHLLCHNQLLVFCDARSHFGNILQICSR